VTTCGAAWHAVGAVPADRSKWRRAASRRCLSGPGSRADGDELIRQPPETPPGWTLLSRTPNPWGIVPVTAGGESLTVRAHAYVRDLHDRGSRRDSVYKRHHYVPQGYLRAWSADGHRVHVIDTSAGTERLQGLRDTCVKENFYQVCGPEGGTHNQVEEMLAVLDHELVRVVRVLRGLDPGDDLAFEDFMSLGLMMILQRTRTPQSRRLMSAWHDWYQQQMSTDDSIASRPGDAQLTCGVSVEVHVNSVFNSMWSGADNLTTRTWSSGTTPRPGSLPVMPPSKSPMTGHHGRT
jgi:hypothetical protein